MELPVPTPLGGRHYLAGVTVGRWPDGEGQVRDCPFCGGYAADDEFHLRARVRGPDGVKTYPVCGENCLSGWLAVARVD